MQSTVEGSLWGGVSGLALMGLEAVIDPLLDLPSWMSDYSGINQGCNEISYREAISRFLGQSTRDYIAEQGIANAEVILATFKFSTTMKFEYGSVYNLGKDTYLRVEVTGNYSQYNFVQTVSSSNQPNNSSRLDGDGSDGGRGFWRHPDCVDIWKGPRWIFEDTPYQGSDIDYWTAELTIVGKYRAKWYPITTVTWGFSKRGGKLKLIPEKIRPIKPSQFHSNWVNRACYLHSGIFL